MIDIGGREGIILVNSLGKPTSMSGGVERKQRGVSVNADGNERQMDDKQDKSLKRPQIADDGENVFVMKTHF